MAGARRAGLVVDATAARQQVRDLLECAWPAAEMAFENASASNATAYVWSSKPLAGKEASTIWLVPRTTPGIRSPQPFDGLGLRGLRIGTAAVTTTGMAEGEMERIANLIGQALRGRADQGRLATLVDNLLDLSHETYLHGGYIGTPEVAATPITTEVDEDAGVVYVSRHMDDAECPPFYSKSTGLEGRIARWQDIEYTPPCLYKLHSRIGPVGSEPRPDGTDPDDLSDLSDLIVAAYRDLGELGLL